LLSCSCIHMATVGVKGLTTLVAHICIYDV